MENSFSLAAVNTCFVNLRELREHQAFGLLNFRAINWMAKISLNGHNLKNKDAISIMTERSLQTHNVYFTLKRPGNDRFYVASTWKTRGVFVGLILLLLDS